MRYLMFLLGLLFTNVANAMDCEKVPDCASLGYSTEPDQNCADNGYMYCPFDTNYKVCVQYDCAKMGFTESDKSTWCADLIECKGNSKMTLCQKACVATKYEELKDLAESGKCKLITIKNDITLPLNQGITLAANTTIDGGGHTLQSSGNKGYILIHLNNQTGLENLKIHHTQTDTQINFTVLSASKVNDLVSLKDVDIFVSSDDHENHATPVINQGTYDIRGKFALNVEAYQHMVAFWMCTYNFTDAQVSIKTTGNSSDFTWRSKMKFTNSTVNASIGGSYFVGEDTYATFKNSDLTLIGNTPFWGSNNAEFTIEESHLTLEGKRLHQDSNPNLILKGTSEHPSVLKLSSASNSGETTIQATNTYDTLILDGLTYRPKQVGKTPLSEIPNSPIWELVQ